MSLDLAQNNSASAPDQFIGSSAFPAPVSEQLPSGIEQGSSAHWVAIAFATYALVGGVITLIGWFAHLPSLTDWVGSGIAMFANTAAAGMCTGAAVLLRAFSRPWAFKASSALALVVALLGVATLFQHLSGINLGIDTVLVNPAWGNKAAVTPGRMGPPASTCFTLLGIALLLGPGSARIRRLIPALGILVSAIALLSVTGYIFGANPLYSVARYTGIAFQTATIILALGLAVIASVPECEPVRTFSQNTAAGLLARRSLPFIIVLPIALGWWRIQAEKAGWFDTGMGTAALVLTLIAILSGLLWWWVKAVAIREDALREIQENLERTVDERTAKLREMVTELQQVSYAITHDMRAPLRAMSTFAQLLLEQSSGPGADLQNQDYCRRILTASSRLDKLIQDALSYSKAVLQELPMEPVDLSRLVRGLLDTYPNLHPDRAAITIEGPLPVVLGNESLLTQCFSNLLGNAVKFVPAGSRPQVRIWADGNGSLSRISVQDNGIGIPAHAHERLFGMFQKLDTEYEGTGVGLAIVRKVVERMGGRVGFKSNPGEGSCFWVELRPVPPKGSV